MRLELMVVRATEQARQFNHTFWNIRIVCSRRADFAQMPCLCAESSAAVVSLPVPRSKLHHERFGSHPCKPTRRHRRRCKFCKVLLPSSMNLEKRPFEPPDGSRLNLLGWARRKLQLIFGAKTRTLTLLPNEAWHASQFCNAF